jgi:hypothetical protein
MLDVDGKRFQNGSNIHDGVRRQVPDLYLSRFMSLQPGDVIYRHRGGFVRNRRSTCAGQTMHLN